MLSLIFAVSEEGTGKSVPSFFRHMSIEAYIESVLGQGEFDDCFLVDLIEKDRVVQVYFDSDTQVTLERCRKLSRLLEEHIEEHKLLPENYKLDVSSPGLDRPLKFRRQYVKNIGRKLEVKVDDEKLEGILQEVGESEITLRIQKSKKEQKEITVSLSAIDRCKVIPSF